jgi:hypothetical protein
MSIDDEAAALFGHVDAAVSGTQSPEDDADAGALFGVVQPNDAQHSHVDSDESIEDTGDDEAAALFGTADAAEENNAHSVRDDGADNEGQHDEDEDEDGDFSDFSDADLVDMLGDTAGPLESGDSTDRSGASSVIDIMLQAKAAQPGLADVDEMAALEQEQGSADASAPESPVPIDDPTSPVASPMHIHASIAIDRGADGVEEPAMPTGADEPLNQDVLDGESLDAVDIIVFDGVDQTFSGENDPDAAVLFQEQELGADVLEDAAALFGAISPTGEVSEDDANHEIKIDDPTTAAQAVDSAVPLKLELERDDSKPDMAWENGSGSATSLFSRASSVQVPGEALATCDEEGGGEMQAIEHDDDVSDGSADIEEEAEQPDLTDSLSNLEVVVDDTLFDISRKRAAPLPPPIDSEPDAELEPEVDLELEAESNKGTKKKIGKRGQAAANRLYKLAPNSKPKAKAATSTASKRKPATSSVSRPAPSRPKAVTSRIDTGRGRPKTTGRKKKTEASDVKPQLPPRQAPAPQLVMAPAVVQVQRGLQNMTGVRVLLRDM